MKATNYEVLHYVFFNSSLLTSLSHVQIIFCLRPVHQNPKNNKPLKSLVLKNSCFITGWRVGFPNKTTCT